MEQGQPNILVLMCDQLQGSKLGLVDAVAWLRDYQPGPDPLFFVYSTNLPHSPIHWVPEHEHRFPVDDMKLPRSFYAETFENKPPFQEEHSQAEHHAARDEDFAKLEQAQYYSMISAADDVHGRIISEFKAGTAPPSHRES